MKLQLKCIFSQRLSSTHSTGLHCVTIRFIKDGFSRLHSWLHGAKLVMVVRPVVNSVYLC